MTRFPQVTLIVSTLVTSWLGMQALHESGHVLGALVTGAEVKRVVLHPLTISRTDLGKNPHPLAVVWAGPIIGVMIPLTFCGIVSWLQMPGAFVFRFVAGFCCVANGAYIAYGSMDGIGDCGEMLRNGSPMWHLWLFGVCTIPVGFMIWHGQGKYFGLGSAHGKVDNRATGGTLLAALLLLAFGLTVGSH